MKKILFFIISTLTVVNLFAGAAFSEARDKNDNTITWTFFTEEKMSPAKCADAAIKALKKEGHGNVLSTASTKLDHGFWAVIFAYYEVDGNIRFRYGFGFSSKSVEDAEKDAVENLKKNDKKWTPEKGYKVKETNQF